LPQNSISLTVKNYEQFKKGTLSGAIHNSRIEQDKFNIQGPMGTGLRIRPSGTHIAFAAGTGALVFLDLAAECLLKATGHSHESYLQDDFKFVYYIYA